MGLNILIKKNGSCDTIELEAPTREKDSLANEIGKLNFFQADRSRGTKKTEG